MTRLSLRHEEASGDKLKVSSNSRTAAQVRSAIGGALMFCRHLISQLGFADVGQCTTCL